MTGWYPIEGGYFIYGDAEDNTLQGTEIHDEIAGWEGDDLLYGNGGDDVMWGNSGNDWLFGGWGNDELWGSEGNDYLFGEMGNDILVGESGDDFLVGAEGEDWLYGWDGNDFLTGGNGNDVLFGDEGEDVLFGDDGNDILIGGEGADHFYYSSGNDIIIDANWNDTIYLPYIPWQADASCYYDSWNEVMNIYTSTGTLQINCATGYYYNPRTCPVYEYADGSRWTYVWSGINSNDNWHQISWSYDVAEDTGADIATNPLWGNANTFYSTADADNIFINKTGGNDLIFNAAQDDTIHLCDTALSDIVATSVSENSIAIAFNTGEVAMVGTTENLSPTFKLARGESYVYNRKAGSWQEV